ncbi:MAG: nitroreductase family protein [Deltaproteobacteria bacterium]|nr:nitroreductase family protein [Deltaproteobacteria bacterium]
MIVEAIKTRRSCRTFSPEAIEAEKIKTLEGFFEANTKGPFGNRLRFELVNFDVMNREAVRACGTYGIIRGASYFIVGAVKKKVGAMEDFGYGMERNILQARSLGLGTCWLGGTFKRSGFADRIGLSGEELLPAVSPIGYAADKISAIERVFRLGAGSDRRKPWEALFFDRQLNALKKGDAGPYERPLDCVRLGPSAANRQPWRIVKDGDCFHFYVERSMGYSSQHGKVKLQSVDMGIAMCHFELSSRELGLNGYWLFDNPGLNAGKWEHIVTWQACG